MSAKLAAQIKTMLKMYGNGPDGRQCKHCQHLRIKGWGRPYFKCDLNRDTGGPASDWRVTWPACGKYGERDEA